MKEEERIVQSDKMVEVMAHSKKMGLSVTAAKNIRRQLEKLDKELKKKKTLQKLFGMPLKILMRNSPS